MRDGRVSEQPTHVRLRERHEIAEQDRQRSEDGEHGRPAGEHRVPVGTSTSGRKTNQHNFSKHDERRHLRARSNKKRMRNSSLRTSSINPTEPSSSTAIYSPGLRRDFSEDASGTVTSARTRQIILKSEFSGEITSMPPNKFACDGSMSTAPIATAVPIAATMGHNAFARVLVSPTVRTASAVTTTIPSGAASLSNSR